MNGYVNGQELQKKVSLKVTITVSNQTFTYKHSDSIIPGNYYCKWESCIVFLYKQTLC